MSTETKQITVPEKRAYNTKEFVGRHKEIDEVKRRVIQGQEEDKIDSSVIGFWGVEGSGKSWLVRHIARFYRGPGQLSESKHKRTFTALIDFADFDPFEWTPRNLADIFEPVVKDIMQQLKDIIPNPTGLLASIEAAKTGKKTAKKLADSFVQWIKDLTQQFVPLVLLDTLERVTPEALIQLELHIIEPLVGTDKVVLVTAGRREVSRWRRFAVRKRQSKPAKLASFNLGDTASQIQKQGFNLPGELVYDYSFGLAYASQVIATAISELSNGHIVDKDFLRKNEHRLEPWLTALDKHLLRSVSEKLRDILHVLCVLRTIHEGVLHDLLSFKDSGTCRDLLDELEITPFVWWDSDRGVYLMPSSLRKLLSLKLRLQDPASFSNYHHRAANYYRETIQKNPYDCGNLVIEALYHIVHEYGEQSSGQIKEWLDQVLVPENFTVGGVEFLLEQLEKDQELRSVLGSPLIDQVVQSVQDLRHEVRSMRLSTS